MSERDSPATHPGPLEASERRVLGVLVEKAKTTPDAYPLSMNALRSGCNQKSNRFPQMQLDEEQIERTVDSLRAKGALSVVQSDSRVERCRHRLYEWLGVEKTELAVVAELLCRGAQTVGDLRGRAARMEPIAGMTELKPILEVLIQKGLVVYLSPPGRGAIVSHTFYSPGELERVRRDLGISGEAQPSIEAAAAQNAPMRPAPTGESRTHADPPTAEAKESSSDLKAELIALRDELTTRISELRDEVEQLRQRIDG